MKSQFIFLYLLFSVYISAMEVTPLKVITEDWPPYNYIENGEIRGFSYEIVRYIINDLKLDIDVELLPAARADKMLNEEKNIMFFSLFRTPEREFKYKWIGPINEEEIYFYKRKNSSVVINDLDDAKNVKRVSTRKYGLVHDYLLKVGFKNLDTSHNNDSVFLKVIHNRSDLAISESQLGIIYRLKKLNQPLDILEKTNVRILKYTLYIATSLDIGDDVIQLWQSSLDKMKRSGEYNRVYEKFLH